jgi:hypothetical protein
MTSVNASVGIHEIIHSVLHVIRHAVWQLVQCGMQQSLSWPYGMHARIRLCMTLQRERTLDACNAIIAYQRHTSLAMGSTEIISIDEHI